MLDNRMNGNPVLLGHKQQALEGLFNNLYFSCVPAVAASHPGLTPDEVAERAEGIVLAALARRGIHRQSAEG